MSIPRSHLHRAIGASIAALLIATGSASAAPVTRISAFASFSEAKAISPAFVTKTDRLCATIDAHFRRTLGTFPYPTFDPTKPDPKTLVLVGEHFAKGLPIRRAIPGQLRKLGEPAAGKQAWDAIRSLALRENAVAIDQVSAALASSTKAFVASLKQLDRLHAAITRKAIAAGFPKTTACGELF
jgi:hypothetical protein